MTTLTEKEIEQLKLQLKEKQEEVKAIYDQLVEAGAVPLPDDFLDSVTGESHPHPQSTAVPSYSTTTPVYKR